MSPLQHTPAKIHYFLVADCCVLCLLQGFGSQTLVLIITWMSSSGHWTYQCLELLVFTHDVHVSYFCDGGGQVCILSVTSWMLTSQRLTQT
jgi:hypothetical protein